MKKVWKKPIFKKIGLLEKITLGGSGSKTEKTGQTNRNRRPA